MLHGVIKKARAKILPFLERHWRALLITAATWREQMLNQFGTGKGKFKGTASKRGQLHFNKK